MGTETYAERYRNIDTWSNDEALESLLEAQFSAIAAIRPALPALAAAIDATSARLRTGGRLVYAGAGASGRLAVQDGAELLPTFNWPIDRMIYLLAGGEAALLRSAEQAEDSAEDGATAVNGHAIGEHDVVLGVAASGRTPYTLAVIDTARTRGALTIAMANNPGAVLLERAEIAICLDTGAEVIAGSTRMKAGTAQKVALNLFSTQLMNRLGHVYAGLMVDMRPANSKLNDRSRRMVEAINHCSPARAETALITANGHVKLAALIERGLDKQTAAALLEGADGNLREALAALARQNKT